MSQTATIDTKQPLPTQPRVWHLALTDMDRLCFDCPLDDCHPHSLACPVRRARAQQALERAQ